MSAFNDVEAALQTGKPITKLVVHSGDVLDGFQASNGATVLPLHGGDKSGTLTEIPLAADEYLVGIFGSTGDYFGARHVVQIYFVSNKQVYGPIGTANNASNKRFFKHLGDSPIVAFFGSTTKHTNAGEGITSLGYAVLPVT